jgi:hypothetical protein
MISSVAFVNTGIAGEPTQIPWPVGYSESEMHYSRDLLRTCGNTNGVWGDTGNFHPGIDIPYNTEVVDGCNEVRCVREGYVTYETASSDDIEGYVILPCKSGTIVKQLLSHSSTPARTEREISDCS